MKHFLQRPYTDVQKMMFSYYVVKTCSFVNMTTYIIILVINHIYIEFALALKCIHLNKMANIADVLTQSHIVGSIHVHK